MVSFKVFKGFYGVFLFFFCLGGRSLGVSPGVFEGFSIGIFKEVSLRHTEAYVFLNLAMSEKNL